MSHKSLHIEDLRTTQNRHFIWVARFWLQVRNSQPVPEAKTTLNIVASGMLHECMLHAIPYSTWSCTASFYFCLRRWSTRAFYLHNKVLCIQKNRRIWSRFRARYTWLHSCMCQSDSCDELRKIKNSNKNSDKCKVSRFHNLSRKLLTLKFIWVSYS